MGCRRGRLLDKYKLKDVILCGSTLSLGLHENRPRFEISSLKTEKSIWNIETLTKRTNFNSVKPSIKCTKSSALEIINLSLSLERALLWNKSNSLISKTSLIVLFPFGMLLLFNTKLSQWKIEAWTENPSHLLTSQKQVMNLNLCKT